MKLWDQIRDRGWFYITALIAYGLILLFLTAYRVSSQLIIFISGICILFVIAEETIGYLRKRAFYNSIAEKLEILDKKYTRCFKGRHSLKVRSPLILYAKRTSPCART